MIEFLTSSEGKDELEELGGLSKSTAGAILREPIILEAQGMDKFFGEPESDTAELLRTALDGRGVASPWSCRRCRPSRCRSPRS